MKGNKVLHMIIWIIVAIASVVIMFTNGVFSKKNIEDRNIRRFLNRASLNARER